MNRNLSLKNNVACRDNQVGTPRQARENNLAKVCWVWQLEEASASIRNRAKISSIDIDKVERNLIMLSVPEKEA